MDKVLIAMAVHDTDENQRTELTERVLNSLYNQDIFTDHDFWVVDNNSCQATKDILASWAEDGYINLITNEQNIGTAEAVNLAWKHRTIGQHCVKMDNDVTINYLDWVKEMAEAIQREARIGIVVFHFMLNPAN